MFLLEITEKYPEKCRYSKTTHFDTTNNPLLIFTEIKYLRIRLTNEMVDSMSPQKLAKTCRMIRKNLLKTTEEMVLSNAFGVINCY
jgi:hypothetical protein